MTAIVRIASAAMLCALLGGCGAMADSDVASAELTYPPMRHPAPRPQAPAAAAPAATAEDADNGPSTIEGAHLQCVPYAREHSAVNLHGNANTWWAQAEGVYAKGSEPVEGAVMVLTGYGRNRGHVAVVRRLANAREIRVDHANWLDDGAIYVNDPVIDVSENNDWSAVKVWNIRSGSWGTRTYTVQGFIGPALDNPLVASNAARRPAEDLIARQIALADAADDTRSDDDR